MMDEFIEFLRSRHMVKAQGWENEELKKLQAASDEVSCLIKEDVNKKLSVLLKEAPSLSKSLTNADRIRSMTDEELAERIFQCLTAGPCPAYSSCIRGEDCVTCWLNWLKQEVKDGD